MPSDFAHNTSLEDLFNFTKRILDYNTRFEELKDKSIDFIYKNCFDIAKRVYLLIAPKDAGKTSICMGGFVSEKDMDYYESITNKINSDIIEKFGKDSEVKYVHDEKANFRGFIGSDKNAVDYANDYLNKIEDLLIPNILESESRFFMIKNINDSFNYPADHKEIGFWNKLLRRSVKTATGIDQNILFCKNGNTYIFLEIGGESILGDKEKQNTSEELLRNLAGLYRSNKIDLKFVNLIDGARISPYNNSKDRAEYIKEVKSCFKRIKKIINHKDKDPIDIGSNTINVFNKANLSLIEILMKNPEPIELLSTNSMKVYPVKDEEGGFKAYNEKEQNEVTSHVLGVRSTGVSDGKLILGKYFTVPKNYRSKRMINPEILSHFVGLTYSLSYPPKKIKELGELKNLVIKKLEEGFSISDPDQKKPEEIKNYINKHILDQDIDEGFVESNMFKAKNLLTEYNESNGQIAENFIKFIKRAIILDKYKGFISNFEENIGNLSEQIRDSVVNIFDLISEKIEDHKKVLSYSRMALSYFESIKEIKHSIDLGRLSVIDILSESLENYLLKNPEIIEENNNKSEITKKISYPVKNEINNLEFKLNDIKGMKKELISELLIELKHLSEISGNAYSKPVTGISKEKSIPFINSALLKGNFNEPKINGKEAIKKLANLLMKKGTYNVIHNNLKMHYLDMSDDCPLLLYNEVEMKFLDDIAKIHLMFFETEGLKEISKAPTIPAFAVDSESEFRRINKEDLEGKVNDDFSKIVLPNGTKVFFREGSNIKLYSELSGENYEEIVSFKFRRDSNAIKRLISLADS